VTAPAKPKSFRIRLRFLDQDGIAYMAKYVLEWGTEGEVHPTEKPAEPEALDADGMLDVVVDARFTEGTLYLQSHLKPLDRKNYQKTALAIVPVTVRDMAGPFANALRLKNLGLLVSPTVVEEQDAARRFQYVNSILEADATCSGMLAPPPGPPGSLPPPSGPGTVPTPATATASTARLLEVHDTKDSKFYPIRW
jgi:hypothetical protein